MVIRKKLRQKRLDEVRSKKFIIIKTEKSP